MRLFIAIELDNQVKNVLNSIQGKIERHLTKGNPTAFENFHITLRFIGEATEKEAENLKTAVNKTARQIEPFTLYLNDLGQFPRKSKAILWTGVKGEVDKLFELKEKLEAELETVGYSKEERDFTAHITLVRQAVLKKTYDEVKEDLTVPEKEIGVKSISVMESKRVEGELVYETIHQKSFSEVSDE